MKPWQKHYDPGVPETLKYPDWTISDLLEMTVSKHPNYLAVCFNDLEITYKELLFKVIGLANGLKHLGIQKRDRIALLLPNSPTYVVAYYAVVKLGAIVANINVMNHGEELKRILNHSEVKAVVTLDIFLKNVTDIVSETSVEHILIHSVFGMEKEIVNPDQLPPIHIVNDLVERFGNQGCETEAQPDDIAVLQYTSGVTGTPKAAILTHRTLISNLIQIDSWNTRKTTENRAVLCIIPFFHVFGMTVCMHVSILSGYKMVLFPQFDWSSVISILDAIRKYNPISFPAVPALWSALVSSSEVKRADLSSIEVASGGGAPLSIDIQEKHHKLTGNFISQAYGLSEVSSTAVISPFINGKISESVGLPLPDTDIKIVGLDNRDKECKQGDIGEIAIKGPQVMKGYWQDEEKTNRSLEDGWLFTSDLGYMDEQGYLYLVDRKDDLIISKGFNVYPSQIEETLKKHPGIQDAVVVGRDDPKRGQSITACLISAIDSKPDRKELSTFCHQHLADYQVPRTFKFVEDIPKNKIGKPLRRLLREELDSVEE